MLFRHLEEDCDEVGRAMRKLVVDFKDSDCTDLRILCPEDESNDIESGDSRGQKRLATLSPNNDDVPPKKDRKRGE